MKRKFGIAVFRHGTPRDEQEFDLIWFFANPGNPEFTGRMDKEKEFTRFLKQWRAGQ